MSLACTSCRCTLKDGEDQRAHYKSEWHHYNLKRQLCQLPPLTEDIFMSRNEVLERETKELSLKKGGYCEACSKRFTTENAYENHKKSKRHVQNVKDASERPRTVSESTNAEAMEEEEEEEIEPLGLEECLFCSNIANSVTGNVAHMSKAHSFFIPDAEFLVDVEGLISHLDEKVGVGHMCLWCNERSKMFYSVDAVRKHMRDKGHCKLMFDGDAALEYADFYDFRPSWDGVESTNEAESENAGDELSENENYELVLPSGATIGHRSLQRYYRQSLPPERQVQLHRAGQTKIGAVLSQYRAIGWNGSSELSKQRRQDLAFAQREKRRFMRLGVKNNQLLQKHFRPQVIF